MNVKGVKTVFLLLALLFVIPTTQAQFHLPGTPLIKNYTRGDYLAGQQNWMIDQGMDGRIYFANNEGLLEFDGLNWHLIKLPKNVILRSVFSSSDGKLYVGGYNEIGCFEPDTKGKLSYRSLTHLLPEKNKNFDDIWRIHQTAEGIIFQSFSQLIIFNQGKLKVVKAPGKFHFSYYVNGQLIVVDLQKGLMLYSMGKFFPLPGTGLVKGKEIWTILPFDDKMLIATSGEGIYLYDGTTLKPWYNESAQFLKQNQVYSAIRINKDIMAFGTIQNGLILCHNKGTILQKINRDNGLQNNTILCLKLDETNNLWVGSDNGIDYLEINSPLSILSYESGISAGYTAALFNNKLYLGTNQGVFYQPWKTIFSRKTKFKLIEETRGQVWTLQVIDNKLFCGSNNGTYIINDTLATKIVDIPGEWTFLKVPGHPDELMAGTYSGIIRLVNKQGHWQYDKPVKGFNESSRMLAFDIDSTLWMSHGFKGVYHLFLNNRRDSVVKVKFYNSKKGFPTDFGINLTRIDGKIYFTTPDGIYKYNFSSDAFEKSSYYNEIFPSTNLQRVQQDNDGNLWYFSTHGIGVIRVQEDGKYVPITLPFKQIQNKMVKGFEFVYPIDNQTVLFGSGKGFIFYNPTLNKNYRQPFKTHFHRVSIVNPDSVIFWGHGSNLNIEKPVIKHTNNAIYFSFAANDFENNGKTFFSTYLKGYDPGWTKWESRTNRDFTNLYEGNYTFMIKARNIYDEETKPVSFRFTVLPPWYRTNMAYLLYVFIGLCIMLLTLWIVRKRFKLSKLKEEKRQKEKFEKREEKLKQETLEAEKEIIRLRNEKLRGKMIMKDKELANATLTMIQKNDLLNTIKKELQHIASGTRDEQQQNQIKRLIKKINREVDTEKQWEVFETHFESVHEAFLKRLKTGYPDLSPRELKLCAYLRLNISSKEIAILMNISTRGVEISRYRLRKKLGLSRTDNLTDFILSF